MKSSELGYEQGPAAQLEERLGELHINPEIAGPVNVLVRALARMTEGDIRRAVAETLSGKPGALSVAELGPILNEQLDPETSGRIAGMTQELDRLASDEGVRGAVVASLEEVNVEDREEAADRPEKNERTPAPENPLSPLESRLQEAGLDAEQAAQLQALAEEAVRLAGGNNEALDSMAEFFITWRGTAHEDEPPARSTDEPSAEAPPEDAITSEPPTTQEAANETEREKVFSPEHLVRAAAAYNLDMWSAEWGPGGAGAKTSKGMAASVLNRKKTNRSRLIMYGMDQDYFDFATLLEDSGIAEEWLGYSHLEKGEAVVLQLDEQNGKPEREGEVDTSDSTFLLAFVSAHYDKPNGRRSEDEVSFMCTLPHEEAAAVRKNPSLLARMVPLLEGVPEKYKNLADDLTIKERLNLEPGDLPLVAEKITRARSGGRRGWQGNDDRLRKNIGYRIASNERYERH